MGRPKHSPGETLWSLTIRMARYTDRSGDCWIWTGASDHHGYGRLKVPGTVLKAHRVAYELASGTHPGALDVCHRCDTPACVRPEHLFLGTHAENMADMKRKGRAGAARGEDSGMVKYTPEIVASLRADNARGIGYRRLSRLYEMPRSTVQGIVRGERWAHLPNVRPAPGGHP